MSHDFQWKGWFYGFVPAFAAVFFLASQGIAQAEDLVVVGKAVEVRHIVKAEDMTGKKRNIEVDGPLYYGDEVYTAYEAYVKLKLLDETTFTLGSHSRLVLDEFVYDPNTGAGQVTVSVTKGLFRFLTGKIVKENPENMEVKMAVGSIGIRGTQVAGESQSNQSFAMLEKPENAQSSGGHIVVWTQVGGQRKETLITEFGFGSTLKKGEAPSPAFEVPERDQKRLQNQLTPPPEESQSPLAAFDEIDNLGIPQTKDSPDGSDLAFESPDQDSKPQSDSEHLY